MKKRLMGTAFFVALLGMILSLCTSQGALAAGGGGSFTAAPACFVVCDGPYLPAQAGPEGALMSSGGGRVEPTDSESGGGGENGEDGERDEGEGKKETNRFAWLLVCVSGTVIVVNSVVLFSKAKKSK